MNRLTPAVAFRGVGKTFDMGGRAYEAIRGFSLDIAAGELVAIVGASGCGKSTLLRLLVGLDTEFDGEIRVDGEPIAGIGAERGIVFQEHRLFPWLTVARNVALGVAAQALPGDEAARRVADAIRLVGLDGFDDALPHQLSGGMAQRVAIARGLVARPRILMLDEPFGALDALTRHQLQDELLRIRERERITTLFVTHDVDEAVVLADRVVVMRPRPGRIGQVVEIALPRPRDRGSYDFHRYRERLTESLLSDGVEVGDLRAAAHAFELDRIAW
ncbi:MULTISPECIES: ABC transporter ATP-binding protein [unclassified Burkholderia]|uniref:ABC transporter ATP-binding protein n=1 Tax=Burkholderia sp. MSMB1498 TaxID=1637842 RepID=UPI00075E1944|nr:ABC transporter ATP-binding protein [Burkholderia sp. MSMB617WGS]KVK89739.1 ABC transporter ATP-binding protein [Burkholderia sp. MSMB1498]